MRDCFLLSGPSLSPLLLLLLLLLLSLLSLLLSLMGSRGDLQTGGFPLAADSFLSPSVWSGGNDGIGGGCTGESFGD